MREILQLHIANARGVGSPQRKKESAYANQAANSLVVNSISNTQQQQKKSFWVTPGPACLFPGDLPML